MRRNKCFIDTGAWIALINGKDQYHDQAVLFYQTMDPSVHRFTSNYVISETYTWLRYRTGFQTASRVLQLIRQGVFNGTLSIIEENEEIIRNAEQLLRDFPDQKLSYVDAISIAMMHKEGIAQVFGFDHHFYLLKFDVVPAAGGEYRS